ncbi:MAG TPA: hypothetical protein VMC07_01210 [Candidatus Omnitrophota bacterium]|nr:hypothetical protein [Candidatus Omnitrophota bacterium]
MDNLERNYRLIQEYRNIDDSDKGGHEKSRLTSELMKRAGTNHLRLMEIWASGIEAAYLQRQKEAQERSAEENPDDLLRRKAAEAETPGQREFYEKLLEGRERAKREEAYQSLANILTGRTYTHSQ